MNLSPSGKRALTTGNIEAVSPSEWSQYMTQWGVPTQITINTALLGLNAANPMASGFMNAPGFNITQVQSFIVDENARWVGGPQPVPPPGGQIRGMWNYWHNIAVTPNLLQKGTDPIKWSQPPVKLSEGPPPVFKGWDEKSLYQWRAIVADDWLCETNDPVTDIHWWGSFIGWDQPVPPQPMPKAFHIGIWTNVPANPPNEPFSRPGQMIWEHYCDNYQWNFAGFDDDPRDPANPEQFREACFQFVQYLPEDHWFYQQEYGGPGTIFWLSIAAVYDEPPMCPWDWKTREHFFEDDAVRIRQARDPRGMLGWPPHVGWSWGGGVPIQVREYPEPGVTWNVAFELTTRLSNQPYNDLGDAPDSSNSFGVAMTAYPPAVAANFPTIYQIGSPPYGPIHLNPKAVAYLGNAVTLENEADTGPDQDPTNNINPPNNAPDLDLADDCIVPPLTLPHCVSTTFNYTVTVVIPNQQLYVNVWFDWNRDGDWDDTMQCPIGGPAPEWAVQNQTLVFASPGTYTVTTPQFLPWHPTGDPTPIWMRITLADQPWQPASGIIGDGGSGPSAGYTFGETEDCCFIPELPHTELDWGDAPDPLAAPRYPTRAANFGANHVIMPGFCLGNLIDAENDGLQDPNALGDDSNKLDDEEGATFNTALFPGVPNTITVTASIPPGSIPYLNAWIDFNRDGDWADPGEQILVDRGIANGANSYTFTPGAITAVGETFARFRMSTQRGLREFGNAPDGEVEDYKVDIIPVKWLQRPDLSTYGVDVDNSRVKLADDFRCTQIGLITDIHIWTSFLNNIWPPGGFNSLTFDLEIWSDVPNPDPQNPEDYSHPGTLLWSKTFAPFTYNAGLCANVQDEWWHDPVTNFWRCPGDTQCYQYDF